MSNSFERFRKKNGAAHQIAQEKLNTSFIFQGYPSVEIVEGKTGSKLQAAVVNKQERDEAYIYTQLCSPLEIGSIWKAKSLNLLVDEEITVIKDVGWHKYHCILCNISFDDLFGYFIGPEKSHININLRKDVLLTSQQKPLLVLAGHPLKFQDKIMIKDRAWIVDEFDSISTEGITYYSLMPTTMSKDVIEDNKDKDVFVEQYNIPIQEVIDPIIDLDKGYITVNSGSTLKLQTENGYFKCSYRSLEIKKHTSTEIIFTVPYGVSEFKIKTEEKGVIVAEDYRVVS